MSLIKENIKDLLPSSTLLINEMCKEMSKAGKTIYQFGFGQSPFPVPEKIDEALKSQCTSKGDYLPSKGLFELRKSVAGFLTRKGYKRFKSCKYNYRSWFERINVLASSCV